MKICNQEEAEKLNKDIANKQSWKFNKIDESVGELMLYGEIVGTKWLEDDIAPKQFNEDLKSLGDIKNLNVYINSPGGDVFAGQSIYSMLKRHKATKTVYIDGLAASIASIIAMAGDSIYMPSNAMMMIHNPWTLAMGNADDFRKMAEDLDKIRESMIPVYQNKTGMDEEEIKKLMDNETWLTAEEAVNYGFANEMLKEKKIAASVKGDFIIINGVEMDLKHYKNAPNIACYEEKKEPELETKEIVEPEPEQNGLNVIELEESKVQEPKTDAYKSYKQKYEKNQKEEKVI